MFYLKMKCRRLSCGTFFVWQKERKIAVYLSVLYRTTDRVIPRRGEAPTWESPAEW